MVEPQRGLAVVHVACDVRPRQGSAHRARPACLRVFYVLARSRIIARLGSSLGRALSPAEIEAVYPTLPAQAVDVAILERAAEEERVRMVPIDYRWSDVGSWAAVPEVTERVDGNWPALSGGAQLVSVDTDCLDPAWAPGM